MTAALTYITFAALAGAVLILLFLLRRSEVRERVANRKAYRHECRANSLQVEVTALRSRAEQLQADVLERDCWLAYEQEQDARDFAVYDRNTEEWMGDPERLRLDSAFDALVADIELAHEIGETSD